MLESDEEFIRYVSLHSQTPRALFSREHCVRLAKLANVDYIIPHQAFLEIHYEDMKDVIEMAEKNVRERR